MIKRAATFVAARLLYNSFIYAFFAVIFLIVKSVATVRIAPIGSERIARPLEARRPAII